MSNIRWVIETLVSGSFLGSLLLALTKNLHPERSGLINRWHYFFWYFCMPRLILPALVVLILNLSGFIKL
jgi:hypothetical protein